MLISLASEGGASFPVWSVAPFAGLLLTIAILPLVASHWWHLNRNKALVAVLFGAPVAAYVAWSDPHALLHTGLEYAAFVALLGSLFVISGGVLLRVPLPATAAGNTALLAIGAVLANLVGTTGASMLLIRSFLKINRHRRRVPQVVFFIFIVANCGGCLTALGDPPLFLGFLKGVPFEWTLRLWPQWLLMVGGLLVMFYVVDSRTARFDEPPPMPDPRQPEEGFGLEGRGNLLLLGAVIGVVLGCGLWVHPKWGETASQVVQAGGLGLLAAISLLGTPRRIREANEFSWHPFAEVVVLFAGIFAAMIPALAVLRELGPRLGVSQPWQFFAATGGLSGLLDNAPTYLAFLSMGQFLPDEVGGTTHQVLAAISCGAVFFGAMTYIGNGPNFMVKSIAEHAGVRMPSFFGYAGWALVAVGPLLILTGVVFFR